MSERESSRYIDATAADWIARLDRGPLSQEESQALEAWLSGDARRRGALLRAGALSLQSESAQALGPDFDVAQFARAGGPVQQAPVTRRRMLAWTGAGGLGAASFALLVVGGRPGGGITAGAGEGRLVTLDDGSTIILNTQSSMRVRYNDNIRRVELLYGEAYFTVVPDGKRPFVVDLAGHPLRPARGRFRVRKLNDKTIDIMVDQGAVSLGEAGTPRAVFMPAQTRLTLPAAGPVPAPEPISADLVSRALAWREGRIAFEGEQLSEAAAEFARYSKTRIEIRDPALAREPITGLFAASDPVGFSRAVASALDAQVEQQGSAVILTRQSVRP